MKKETPTGIEQINDYTESKKEAFRQYQRNLPFGEKMQIAFSLAERDKTIRRAVLMPKTTKKDK
jgi:hypothetical protein